MAECKTHNWGGTEMTHSGRKILRENGGGDTRNVPPSPNEPGG